MNSNQPISPQLAAHNAREALRCAHVAALNAARLAWQKQLLFPTPPVNFSRFAQGYGALHLRIGPQNRRVAKRLLLLLTFSAKDTSRSGTWMAYLPGSWRGSFSCRFAAYRAYAQAISQSLGLSVSVQTYA